MIAYGILDAGSFTPILTTLSWGVFILPFLLFSSLAGEVTSTFEKAFLIKWIKVAEVLILGIATLGLCMKSIVLLYMGLFLMGMHATFFLPAKYGLLAAHLKPFEFLGGTGLMESVTFLGVLIGNLLGSFLIFADPTAFLFLLVGFFAAFTGFGISLYILPAPLSVLKKFSFDRFIYFLKRPLSHISVLHTQKSLLFVILGISWFWSYEGTILSQIPTLTKTYLYLESNSVSFFLLLFSIGTIGGGLLCNKLLKGIPSTKLLPLTFILLALFLTDFIQTIYVWENQNISSIQTSFFLFSQTALGSRILFNFTAIAFCGGLSIIPLYALIQARTSIEKCSRIFALNNIMNAFFMVGWSLFVVVLFFLNVPLLNVFLLIAGMNGFLGLASWYMSKTAKGKKAFEVLLSKFFDNVSYKNIPSI